MCSYTEEVLHCNAYGLAALDRCLPYIVTTIDRPH